MFKNISITSKIFGGFGIVLLLLLFVGVVASLNLHWGSESFTRYRSIALQTNQAGLIQAELLNLRLSVAGFLIKPSVETTSKVEEEVNKTHEMIVHLNDLVHSDEKKGVIRRALDDLQDYEEAFKDVAKLQTRRDEIVRDKMNPAGSEMERKLTEIAESAYEANDVVAAHSAGVVQRSMLLMRLSAIRFLENNDKSAFDQVLANSAVMQREERELRSVLEDPRRMQMADDVVDLHRNYESAVRDVFEAINARNMVVADKLDAIGFRLAEDMEELKLSVKKEQDVLGPHASAAMETAALLTVVIAATSLVVGIISAWVIGRGISRPVLAITAAMKALAGGDKAVAIPGVERRDEMGAMAATVQVFKDNMIRADELAAREAHETRLREERGRLIEQLTHNFDAGVSELLSAVAGASTEMESTAHSMSGIATDTMHRATAVASAAEQASANVQTVATATEELSSSIQEISRQVSQSAQIAKRAVDQAQQTDSQIQGLALAAQRIGEVVRLISDIAAQTNLLALNATIEAARAGAAGRGFAVVASEVKDLASQTAKATEEISQQISSIQQETSGAVSAIQLISTTISEINEIAAGIASAVEEQTAATREIARNVEQAATGTEQVTSNILEVTRAASETGSAATQVTATAGELSSKSERLKAQVERFLTDVRAA